MTEADAAKVQQYATLSSLIRSSTPTQADASFLDLNDPESPSSRYLLSLTSKSLHDIKELPTKLSQSKISLNTQLSSLCSQHVSSFVQVHKATSSVPTTLITLDSTLQTLIERDLASLSNASLQFLPQVEAPLKARMRAQNLLTQYETSLKDLMDIPRLIMTCVRASHPVEALQLAVHIMKIGCQNKHNSTIQSLQEECHVHMHKLRDDLLRALGARGLRLPAAKRLVFLLRKLREIDDARQDGDSGFRSKIGVSDSHICLSYLQSRWTILEDLASNLSAPKSNAILSSQLATWRDTVGDTCGMAQVLFPQDSDTLLSEDELAPSTLIASFSRQSVVILQQLLANALPCLPEDSVSLQDSFETFAAIHTQLSYTAASLSRQGVDISRIVSGHTILVKQVIQLWSKAMADAKRDFQSARVGKSDAMCLSWLNNSSALANDLLKESLADFKSANGLTARLMQLPDLRLFTNSMLRSYNALLSFAPDSVAADIQEILDEALHDVINSLFLAVKGSEQNVIEVPLSPIISSQAGSRYYERHGTRQMEANVAILARVLTVLCVPVSNYLRGLIQELFAAKGGGLLGESRLDKLIDVVMKWCEEVDEGWIKAEKARQDRVREEEEKLIAEEAARKEEEARRAEEERELATEHKKKQEEEAERQRLQRLKEEEEAERKRLIRVEEGRRAEEERQRKQSEAEEETKRLAKVEEEKVRMAKVKEEEEERLRLEIEKEAELQRQREEMLEEERILQEQMAKKRDMEAEEEKQRQREVQEGADTAARALEPQVEVSSMSTRQGEQGEKVERKEAEIDLDGSGELGQKGITESVEDTSHRLSLAEERDSRAVPADTRNVSASSSIEESAIESKLSSVEVNETGVNPMRDAASMEQTSIIENVTTQVGMESSQGQFSPQSEQAAQQMQQSGPEAGEKSAKPGNKLAEKLRQRQEQRQRRAEEGSAARVPEERH